MSEPQPVNDLKSAHVNDSYDKLVHPHTKSVKYLSSEHGVQLAPKQKNLV